MKIFVACIATETNTFSPRLTTLDDFKQNGIRKNASSTEDPGLISLMLNAIHRTAEQHDVEVIEGIGAVAQPAGKTTTHAYSYLYSQLLEDLKHTPEVDGVFLILHGAMVSQNCDDCEGDIIQKVRELVGPDVPIAIELDLHCHLTTKMREFADLLLCFKQYPHTDTAQCAEQLCTLLIKHMRKEIKPIMAVEDCNMVGLWRTTESPIQEFVEYMSALEREPGVLNVSFAHSFPWGDIAEADAKVWVTTNNNPHLAKQLVQKLKTKAQALRAHGLPAYLSCSDMLKRIHNAQSFPVVVAEPCDNPGGGASGDATFILNTLIESKKETKHAQAAYLIGCIIDPEAVKQAFKQQVGQSFSLSLGGKASKFSGEPITAQVTLLIKKEEHTQTLFAKQLSFGATVAVRMYDNIDVVLVTKSQQTAGIDAFSALNLKPENYRAVVIKSAQHFMTAFAPIASDVILVNTPAALDHDFANLPYQKRSLDYWPRNAKENRENKQQETCK